MADDALTTVLRMVADGRLTADEAAPILAALEAGSAAGQASQPSSAAPADAGEGAATGGAGRSLRIEVREGGRSVVNLRLPLAIGRYALERVPGLSGDQADRVRAALSTGMTGPVLVVDEDGDGVRISIE